MSNNFRTVALAAALIAASAGASAGIIGVNYESPTANDAELQLIVSSASAQLSYQQDLGITLSQVIGGASFTIPVSATFLNSALATASDATWAVIGYDTYGDVVPDGEGDNVSIYTTIRSTASFGPGNSAGIDSSAVSDARLGWQFWLSTNNLRGTNLTQQNGYYLSPKSEAATYWLDPATSPTNDFSGKIQVGVANPVGVASNFFRLSPSDLFDQTVPATVQQIGAAGHVNFDGATVVLGAVPEPETYALLLAGLLAVGHMVRRQRRA